MRLRLLAGFLEALPLIEDDADAAYLPLSDGCQALLDQEQASNSDDIANHDTGAASVGASAGATHNDGLDGLEGAAAATLAATAQGANDDASTDSNGGGDDAVPVPSPVVCRTRPRRREGPAFSAASANCNPTPRPLTRAERPFSVGELAAAFLLELRVAVDLDTRMAGDEYFEGGCVHGAQGIVFVET